MDQVFKVVGTLASAPAIIRSLDWFIVAVILVDVTTPYPGGKSGLQRFFYPFRMGQKSSDAIEISHDLTFSPIGKIALAEKSDKVVLLVDPQNMKIETFENLTKGFY